MSSSRGFATLISILIISAVGLSVVVSLLLLSIASSRTSFSYEQSLQARWLATACAEEAMQQIRDATSFTGMGNLTLGQGTCSYAVTSQGGQNRTIAATGTVSSTIRKVRVVISKITPTITVTSWQEVADF